MCPECVVRMRSGNTLLTVVSYGHFNHLDYLKTGERQVRKLRTRISLNVNTVNFNTMNSDAVILLETVNFAAEKHRNQRRKDTEQTPYINHPIGRKCVCARNKLLISSCDAWQTPSFISSILKLVWGDFFLFCFSFFYFNLILTLNALWRTD